MVLLLLVALQLLAHGVLLMASQEWAASAAGRLLLEARVAAESAALSVADALPSDVLGRIPAWGSEQAPSGAAGDMSTRGAILRLSREFWVAEGWARARDATWEGRESRLLWGLDPVERIGSFSAVVEVGRMGRVSAGAIRPALSGEECGEWTTALDSIARGTLPSVGSRVGGGLGPAFGRLRLAQVLADIPGHVVGDGSAEPKQLDDSCGRDDPGIWGAGEANPGPCGGGWPTRGATGDVRVEGGVGQGLLVVAGDLEFAGTAFRGLVVAGGEARILGGARVEGLIQAGAGVVVDAASQVLGSRCQALRALAGAPPSIRRLRVVRSRGWLPPL